MALKRYSITTHTPDPFTHVVSEYKNTYIFDAAKITYIIYPDGMGPILNFDYLNRLNLKFDNATHATDWLNDNILVPAAICNYECAQS